MRGELLPGGSTAFHTWDLEDSLPLNLKEELLPLNLKEELLPLNLTEELPLNLQEGELPW